MGFVVWVVDRPLRCEDGWVGCFNFGAKTPLWNVLKWLSRCKEKDENSKNFVPYLNAIATVECREKWPSYGIKWCSLTNCHNIYDMSVAFWQYCDSFQNNSFYTTVPEWPWSWFIRMMVLTSRVESGGICGCVGMQLVAKLVDAWWTLLSTAGQANICTGGRPGANERGLRFCSGRQKLREFVVQLVKMSKCDNIVVTCVVETDCRNLCFGMWVIWVTEQRSCTLEF